MTARAGLQRTPPHPVVVEIAKELARIAARRDHALEMQQRAEARIRAQSK